MKYRKQLGLAAVTFLTGATAAAAPGALAARDQKPGWLCVGPRSR